MKPTWHIIGTSVQGTSHQKNGDTPCQDAHCYRVLADGTLVIAVADGAGSAPRSDEGSHCAVEQSVATLESALNEAIPQDEAAWQTLMETAFTEALQAIIHLDENEESLKPFATTLTCAVACQKWLVVAQIGDGVVVAQTEDDTLFAATQPQHGEYANETFFLTMNGALQRLEVKVYPGLHALAVMTDGLIRLALDTSSNKPHSPFFKPLLDFAKATTDFSVAKEQLHTFLTSERVCNRTDDDKTLVLAVMKGETENEERGMKNEERK